MNEDGHDLSLMLTARAVMQVTSDLVKQQDTRNHREYWESAQTRPEFKPLADSDFFQTFGQGYLDACIKHPFLPVAETRKNKFDRVVELVELAYHNIPIYREKYQAAGFAPSHLKSWEDMEKIPMITKRELIKAFPHGCLNPRFKNEDLFPTRSSGSSGETLLIRVNHEAILRDTIQGIRQFVLQSGLKYRADHLLAHIYTVPWWYENVNNQYHTAFISNVIPPVQVAKHLQDLAPEILSCYPSNLNAVMPFAEQFRSSLMLAVTHSEYSTRHARKMWSETLKCPVLDEYSSEEATRIALEMPCGHYHVCEDAVHLEIVNTTAASGEQDGVTGMAVITNLLNEAMPFIRYVQGDYVTLPAQQELCDITWTQLKAIDGRMNDSFINRHHRIVPSGSLLDITYRWMFDRNLHLDQFELVQKQPDLIEANFVLGGPTFEEHVNVALKHLEDLLSISMEHPVTIQGNIVSSLARKSLKSRPIRCELNRHVIPDASYETA